MNSKFFVVLFIILFISGAMAYTKPTFEGQPLIVSSDKYFYGSDQGQITIDFNIENPTNITYDLYLNITDLYNEGVRISRLKLNDKDLEIETGKLKTNTKLKITKNQISIGQITLTFDPEIIGLGKEFDIQLLNDAGIIIADLDPFLSGWDWRQEWTLNTNGISLSGNITGDHPILFTKNSSDSDFWDNVDSNGNDVRFTDSSNNLYKYHFEEWNSTTDIMTAWVGVTETFDSTTDVTGYIYYGNSGASSDTNVTGTYPSDYKLIYHADDGSGDSITDYSINAKNVALSGTPDWVTGKIGGAVDFKNSITGAVDTGTTPSDYTLMGWFRLDADTDNDAVISHSGTSTGITRRKTDPCAGKISAVGSSWLCGLTAPVGTWVSFAMTFVNGSNTKAIYGNGALIDSEVDSGLSQVSSFYMSRTAGYTDEPMDAYLDEVRVINRALSTDEIKLLHNSDNNTLVTYGSHTSSNYTPTVIITSPVIGEYVSSIDINFNITDTDGADTLDVKLYYSASAGDKDTVIYEDSNLSDASGITCSDYDFTDGANCSYAWNILNISDGNYFVDISSSDGTDINLVSSQEIQIEQRRTIYTRMADFLVENDFETSSLDFQDMVTFDFNYIYPSTELHGECSFYSQRNGIQDIDANFRLEYSIDSGANWVTLTSKLNSFPTDAIRSTLIIDSGLTTPANADQNIMYRLQQARVGGNPSTSIITSDPSCTFMAMNDINGTELFNQDYSKSLSTTSTSFLNVGDLNFSAPNYFYHAYGSLALQFGQTVAKGTPEIYFTKAPVTGRHFLRTVDAGNYGSGGIFTMPSEQNPAVNFNRLIYMKTTAGIGTIDITGFMVGVSFDGNEYARIDMNALSFNSSSLTEITRKVFTNNNVVGSFKQGVALPYECSESSCEISLMVRIFSASYDSNSVIMYNTGASTVGDVRMVNLTGGFNDVPVGDHNFIVYGSVSSGTATMRGGVSLLNKVYHISAVTKVAPSIIPVSDWTGKIIIGSEDYNFIIKDSDGNCLAGNIDVNLLNTSDDSLEQNYSPTLVSASDCNVSINFDSTIITDGNYYFAYAFIDETGINVSGGSSESAFLVDNNAPVILITHPNGGEEFVNPLAITIDFNITDVYLNVLIDLNFSLSDSQGTGTEVLIDEDITGANIICDGVQCSYVWDTSSVADGNYYILINATDQNFSSFDASDGDFNIYTEIIPTPETEYTQRYINPESSQRDDNRYYNPDSEFNLDEDEKQTSELKAMNNFLFYFGVIVIGVLIILGVVLWKRK